MKEYIYIILQEYTIISQLIYNTLNFLFLLLILFTKYNTILVFLLYWSNKHTLPRKA